jgi:WD40 repeat protein
VNSIAIWDKLLFSASNDKTVRVWDRHTGVLVWLMKDVMDWFICRMLKSLCFPVLAGHHYEALSYHSDFVTSLAAATSRNYVVSAGLRGEIFIIDVAASVGQLACASRLQT